MKRKILISIVLAVIAVTVKAPQAETQTDSWPMFHHDLSHTGYSTSEAPSTNVTLWSYTIGAPVGLASPVVHAGMMYVGSQDGKLYCLEATDGASIWTYMTGGPIESAPAIYDNRVYVGSTDAYLYCLDAVTGSLEWQFMMAGPVSSSLLRVRVNGTDLSSS